MVKADAQDLVKFDKFLPQVEIQLLPLPCAKKGGEPWGEPSLPSPALRGSWVAPSHRAQGLTKQLGLGPFSWRLVSA